MAEWSKALRSGRSPLLWAWVRISQLTKNYFDFSKVGKMVSGFCSTLIIYSRVAQWKRAGPITQRSVDRNYALLNLLFSLFIVFGWIRYGLFFWYYMYNHVPLAQRIARWTSNPKVLGSIPRWDDLPFFLYLFQLIVYFEIIHLLTQIIFNCQDGRVV